MAQLTDFISRIFGAGPTRGLSGGADVVVDPDPASAYFTGWLRKHRTDEDIDASPGAFWSSLSFQGKRGGLRAHVTAARAEGPLAFTDALIIVSAEDAQRVGLLPGGAWTLRAAALLQERLEAWVQGERVTLPVPGRRPSAWVVADGSDACGGASLGLKRGEYVTGLVPNTYVAPGQRSRPLVTVHLNIPGAWEGYREVGKLWDDQLVFTMGRHWLDNVHHPALREPALYRLQRGADGTLVHQVAPEFQARYVVRNDALDGGASVVTLAERETGAPLAWIVLAVQEDAPEGASGMFPRKARPEDTGARPRVRSGDTGARKLQRTIIPGAIEGRALTLQERGVLLQKVHFANFMAGYDVHIGAGGLVGTHVPDPRATLQVRGAVVSLVAHEPLVRLDEIPVPMGAPVPLDGAHALEIDGHRLSYRNLTGNPVAGWPYLGELRRTGGGAYLNFGDVHRIGRDRRCMVRLPDEAHNDNIVWLTSVGSGSTIRSRSGDIPKSRFYTDSIMVASEHAEIDLSEAAGAPLVRSLARHCYSYLRRGEAVLPLHPREGAPGPLELPLAPGDELLVGNCLFEVSYPPPEDAAPAPAERPAPPRLGHALTLEVPVAARLGERGLAPRPPQFVELATAAAPSAGAGRGDHAAGATSAPAEPSGGDPAESTLVAASSAVVAEALAEVRRDAAAADGGAPFWTPETAPRADEAEDLAVTSVRATTPRVEPAPAPPAPVLPPVALPALVLPPGTDDVLACDAAEAAAALRASHRLVLEGWDLANGLLRLGNHPEADAILPEYRLDPDASYLPMDLAECRVDVGGIVLEVLTPGEALLTVDGAEVEQAADATRATLEVVRRDADFEERFRVPLCVFPDPSLPGGWRLAVATDAQGAHGITSVPAQLGVWTSSFLAGPTMAVTRLADDRAAVVAPGAHVSVRTGAIPTWSTVDGPAFLASGDRIRVGRTIWRYEAP